MNTYQPRQVDSEAPWRWAREALALLARRPLAYGAATAVVVGLYFAVLQQPNVYLQLALVLLLPPLFIAGFLRLARAADQSEPFGLGDLLPSNLDAVRVLAVAVTGYCVIFAPLLLLSAGAEVAREAGLLGWHQQWEEGAAAAAGGLGISLGLFSQALLLGASLAAFAGLLLGLGAWFMLPLASFNRLGLVQACLLSLQACRLNAAQLRFSSFFVLVGVLLAVVVSFGLLSLLLAPFFGAVLYVSYREVFLGRSQNAPVPVRAGVAAAVRGQA